LPILPADGTNGFFLSHDRLKTQAQVPHHGEFIQTANPSIGETLHAGFSIHRIDCGKFLQRRLEIQQSAEHRCRAGNEPFFSNPGQVIVEKSPNDSSPTSRKLFQTECPENRPGQMDTVFQSLFSDPGTLFATCIVNGKQ
jgi:hypothetical protein